MRKTPIGPIVGGILIIGLIGGFLMIPAKKPAPPPFAIVVAPPTDRPINAASVLQAPVPVPAAQTANPGPGDDPPARREPGAINYADKGVLPAL